MLSFANKNSIFKQKTVKFTGKNLLSTTGLHNAFFYEIRKVSLLLKFIC
tara:strand:+ start:1022 stop:1168 length:147 start_codon:yes stop_codon:yes gene_type:complete